LPVAALVIWHPPVFAKVTAESLDTLRYAKSEPSENPLFISVSYQSTLIGIRCFSATRVSKPDVRLALAPS
jgi:hypothetical protein